MNDFADFTKLKNEVRDYKELGWLNLSEPNSTEEYKKCKSLKHKIIEEQNNPYARDNLCVCHICKIKWHYDCSD